MICIVRCQRKESVRTLILLTKNREVIREVIFILLTILHIALVILSGLNAKVAKRKLPRVCWALSGVIWAILLANDIFKFM